MKLEEWIEKGRTDKEISYEEASRWYATKDRDTAIAVKNDLIIQYRQSAENWHRKIIEYYQSIGIERKQLEFCTPKEWNYSPTGELYEVLMLIADRVKTEQWWREQIARELKDANYDYAIRVVMAPITPKEKKQ